jgi:glyoxylase-like metal-dependent hydrolase (beta-lactamase superfamily II)
MGAAKPEVTGFFDEATASVAYVAADPATRRCAVIDPVLDFDRNARATHTAFADRMAAFVEKSGLTVEWVLDTHPHADHFSAAAYLKEKFAAPMAIGEGVLAVQRIWAEIYDLPELADAGAAPWDRLFFDGDTFSVGSIEARVIATPGHTAASVTYLIGDAAFIADTLFMPDGGTARADFPGADANALFRSLTRILELPPETRLYTGHDYRPNGREARWMSTVAEQRCGNKHLAGMTEDAFVAMRTKRDATLALPALMVDALQVNLRGGRLPAPEANGTSYLKIPLNRFPPRRE